MKPSVKGGPRPSTRSAADLVGHAGAGRDLEIRQYCDLFTIMSQIGALPTAAPA